MKYNVGGYQMIDLSDVTLNSESAVTVKNSKNAEILRTTKKTVHFHGAKLGATVVDALAVVTSATGARDGRVYQMGKFNVTTNDDDITFTPVN